MKTQKALLNLEMQSSYKILNKSQVIFPEFNSISSLSLKLNSKQLSTTFNAISAFEKNNFWKDSKLLNINDAFAINSSIVSINKSLLELTKKTTNDKAMKLASYAEKSILGITSENFASKINFKEANLTQIKDSFITLTGSYSKMMKSFDSSKFYREFDSSIINLTPVEFFSTANLVESISIDEESTIDEEILKSEIIYENEITLSKYLPKFDEGLYNMWKGAVETLNSKNPDKARQFITSIRELFTHLFQKLASDKDIREWTEDPTLFHEGRPKRMTRLLYILRNINDNLFADFIKKDIETILSLIDLFQKGTHSLSSGFTEHQLIAIKSKSESTLKYLLEIHFKTNT